MHHSHPTPSPARIRIRASSVLAALFTLGSGAVAGDWPAWRGPKQDGISPETDWSHTWPADGPKTLWKANVGTGFSGLVVARGTAVTVGWLAEEDVVHALDAETGAAKWTYRYAEKLEPKMYEGGPNATPLIAGDRVFTVSKSGHVHCLGLADGRLNWELNLKQEIGAPVSNWGVSAAPVLADEQTLLINYGPHGVALNPATGRLRWNSGTKKDMSFAAPVVADFSGQRSALFIMSEALVAVDPADGRVRWQSAFGQGFRTHCSDPIVLGDRIFISSGDDGGELLRVNADGLGATRVWKNKNLSTFTGTAVLLDGHLFGHETGGYKAANQQLRCVDLATGSIKWGEGGFGQASVIAGGDRLIVLGEKGELSIVRATPAKYELLGRAQVIGGKCWTTPTLAHRRLYVRNAKGEVICLDLRPAAAGA